jgi:phosphatidylglycerophosphate synthase
VSEPESQERVEGELSPLDLAPTQLTIGRYFWHRVDSERDVSGAVTKILQSTIKPTDGVFARTNRRVSLAISRFLLETPVTPNIVTILTLMVSVVAGVVMAGGSYLSFVLGGSLTWVASMLDGVDGEIARAKFQSSEFGHWLEMTCDYVFYLAVTGGYSVGLYYQTGQPLWLNLGAIGAVGVVLGFLAIAWNKRSYTRREPAGEYYVAFQRTLGAQRSNPFYFFTRHCGFLVTRAAFPYFIFLFAVAGLSQLMFVLVFIGTHLSWILTIYSSRLTLTTADARS